ncbi:MAG: asparaginase domain-containing protein [Candidatus Magasanikbacteria bacterium]|nr:asparaginase domain-containing protein [Candidatus Magasanikbacteria bacterium]
MSIKIFVTGGSFDKVYNEIKEELEFKETSLTKMLEIARCKAEFDIRTLMMIDSLKMTFADRQSILENCLATPEDKILITHGTSTMAETAKMLGDNKELTQNKTVVLTGAMMPNSLVNSDSMFNLGTAVAFVQVLPPGVYIAMNGKVFDWYNVKKNEKIGVFETL